MDNVDRWTCKMKCVAKRPMNDKPQGENDFIDTLYTFINIDSDGTFNSDNGR
jgi:hypothetical protein